MDCFDGVKGNRPTLAPIDPPQAMVMMMVGRRVGRGGWRNVLGSAVVACGGHRESGRHGYGVVIGDHDELAGVEHRGSAIECSHCDASCGN